MGRIKVVKSGVYVLILSPVCVCMFSPVQLFATLWTTDHQASDHEMFQAIILEQVAVSFSRRYSRPRISWDPTLCVRFMGKWIPCHYTTWEALSPHIRNYRPLYREYMLHTKRASFSFPFLPSCLPALSPPPFFFPFFSLFFPTDCYFSRRNALLRK